MGSKFNVGDRVVVKDNVPEPLRGKPGTVRHISSGGSIGVEFDHDFDGHNFIDGSIKSSRGYYLSWFELNRSE